MVDANENGHTSRRYTVVFFVLVMKFTTTYHYQSNIKPNASFIIIAQLRVNSRHKMSAVRWRSFLFRPTRNVYFQPLLLSDNLLSAEFCDGRKLGDE